MEKYYKPEYEELFIGYEYERPFYGEYTPDDGREEDCIFEGEIKSKNELIKLEKQLKIK